MIGRSSNCLSLFTLYLPFSTVSVYALFQDGDVVYFDTGSDLYFGMDEGVLILKLEECLKALQPVNVFLYYSLSLLC